ncbi:uncharacterized protein PHA67_021720 isoform 2-T2 [Liasis olivaceus]
MAEPYGHEVPGGAQLAGAAACGCEIPPCGRCQAQPCCILPQELLIPGLVMEPLLTELYGLKGGQGPPAQAISGKREVVPWERRGESLRGEGPYQKSEQLAQHLLEARVCEKPPAEGAERPGQSGRAGQEAPPQQPAGGREQQRRLQASGPAGPAGRAPPAGAPGSRRPNSRQAPGTLLPPACILLRDFGPAPAALLPPPPRGKWQAGRGGVGGKGRRPGADSAPGPCQGGSDPRNRPGWGSWRPLEDVGTPPPPPAKNAVPLVQDGVGLEHKEGLQPGSWSLDFESESAHEEIYWGCFYFFPWLRMCWRDKREPS